VGTLKVAISQWWNHPDFSGFLQFALADWADRPRREVVGFATLGAA